MALTTEVRERLEPDARAIMARYPQERSALLPMLHLVQSEEGFVSSDGIAFCADLLELTTAEVAAVATFYTQYKRHPNGEYTVGVCINTLCAVMGGDALFETLRDHLDVGHDETTDDGKITLEKIECNAACDYAPVMMVNWEFFDSQTPEKAIGVVDKLRAGAPVAPTRGASSVCTFKQMSRVLAGFPDGRANEGVGAGPNTRRGTELARQHGWTAPEHDRSRHGDAQQRDVAADHQDVTTSRDAHGTSAHDAPARSAGGEGPAGTVAGKPPEDATDGQKG